MTVKAKLRDEKFMIVISCIHIFLKQMQKCKQSRQDGLGISGSLHYNPGGLLYEQNAAKRTCHGKKNPVNWT
jgi:hypothetical protein